MRLLVLLFELTAGRSPSCRCPLSIGGAIEGMRCLLTGKAAHTPV